MKSYIKCVCRLSLIAAFVSGFTTGCDAPRNNPLDPESKLSGLSLLSDNHPTLVENPVLTTTFKAATNDQSLGIFIHERSVVEISADISDKDGVRYVFLEVGDTLRYQLDAPSPAFPDKYWFNFSPTLSLVKFGNMPFTLVAYDHDGNIHYQKPAKYITKVFEFAPTIISPNASNPYRKGETYFKWVRYPTTNHDMSYKIELFNPLGVAETGEVALDYELMLRPESGSDNNIDSLDCNFEVLETGVGGSYFWRISIIDEFGNSAVSSYQSFSVVPDEA